MTPTKKADHPSDLAYMAAAWLLMCEERALRAVAKVESGPHGAFLDDGTPVVLFERHKFSAFTGGRHDGLRVPETTLTDEWPIISDRRPGGYGPVSAQHTRLAFAAMLDRDAALKACSWGLFQCMGFNHAQAGYRDVQRFVNAMYRSADDHLRALVMFLRHDERLTDAIRAKDWLRFALLYNGPAQKGYDERIAKAFEELLQ